MENNTINSGKWISTILFCLEYNNNNNNKSTSNQIGKIDDQRFEGIFATKLLGISISKSKQNVDEYDKVHPF